MSRRHSPASLVRLVRAARGLIPVTCAVLLSGCFGPFDVDPRLMRIGGQLREAGSMVAAERAAEVFDPAAPLLGEAALGTRRAAVGLRMVRSSGFRPDLTTADANPSNTAPPGALQSIAANSQTIVLDGAVRLYAGRRVGTGRYAMFGLDGLARLAKVTTAAPGDDPNAISLGYGGKLGLVSDREQRQGLSVSLLHGTVPGVSYETSFAPTAPATAAEAALRVDKIAATVIRFQGSIVRWGWGITAGLGTNSGNFRLDRRARLAYADSVTVREEIGTGTWNRDLWNVGISRRVRNADVTLQYGQTEASTEVTSRTNLLADTDPRRSVSLGLQFRY